MSGAPAAGVERKPRRWRRRLLWCAGAVVAARLLLWVGLPFAVRAVAATQGYDCRWSSLSLSLLGGAVELTELELAPAAGRAAPASGALRLRIDYLVADLDVLALLHGDIVLRTVEVSSPHAELQLAPPDERVGPEAPPAAAPVAAAAAPVPATAAPISFALPVQVLDLRLHDLRLRIVDPQLPAPHTVECVLHGTATDLGVPDRQGELTLEAASPQCLDRLSVNVRTTVGERRLALQGEVAWRGLHLLPVAAWLQAAGLRPGDAELTGELQLQAHAEPHATDALAAACELSGSLHARVGGVPAAGVERFALTVDRLSPASAGSVQLRVDGLRARAGRSAEGALRALGIEVLPVATAPTAPAPEPVAAAGAPFCERFTAELHDAEVQWSEQATGMPPLLEVAIAQARLGPCSAPAPAPFELRASVPGVAGQLAIDGTLVQRDGATEAAAALTVEAITLERLQPLLASLGLQSTFAAGRLTARVQARTRPHGAALTLDAELADLELVDGERSLRLQQVALRGAAITPDEVLLGAIEIAGPTMALQRQPNGDLDLPGLRVLAGGAAAAVAPAAPAGGAATDVAVAPVARRIHVASLQWRGSAVQFDDHAVTPPATLALRDIELQVTDLVLGGDAHDPPGTIALQASAPGVFAQLRVAGTAQSTAQSLRADLQTNVSGITLEALRPYLAAAGCEPRLQGGELQARLHTELQFGPSTEVSGELTDVALRDGDTTWLRLDRAAVDSLRADAARTAIAAVEVSAAALRVEHLADGAMLVAGVRLSAPAAPAAAAAATSVPSAAAPSTAAAAAPAPAAASGSTTSPSTSPSPSPSGSLRIERCEVKDLALDWHDAPKARDARIVADLRVEPFELGPGAGDSPIELRLDPADASEAITVRGTVRADLVAPGCVLQVEGRGMRGGLLASYLPPNLQVALQNGELTAELSAGLKPAAAGGRALEASGRLELRDGERELLVVPGFTVDAPRLDPAANVFHVASVRVQGVRGECVDHGAAIEVAGLRLTARAAPAAAAAPSTAAVPVAAAPPVAAPPPTAAAPPVAAPPTAAALAAARPPAQWRLDELDVAIDGFRLIDRAVDGAPPLLLTLRLGTRQSWATDAAELANSPPLQLALTATAPPVLANAQLDLDVNLLQMEPRLTAVLRCTGIDTTRLLEVRPSLAPVLAGGDATAAELSVSLALEANLHRRRPDVFDLKVPFALHAELRDLAFRTEPAGTPCLGIEAIVCEAPMIDPRTGRARIHSLVVRTPLLHMQRQADGLHVAGLVLKQASQPAAATPAPVAASTAAPARRSGPGPDLSIAELLVSGLDVRYVDATLSPPLELPLDDLEVRVERFSTTAFRQPETMAFWVTLGGGSIELPRRVLSSSVFAGMIGSAASVVTGGADRHELEQRRWLDEFRVDGKLQLYPEPTGEVRSSCGGLELQALRGLAAGGGVEIGDGLLDFGGHADIRGQGGIDVTSTATFTHLSLSEPAGGPISSWLKLPVPLDTVLFLLRNNNGEQRVPVNYSIEAGTADGSAIIGVVGSALGAVIADAVAKSPLRAAGAVTGLFGFGGGGPELLHERARSVAFAPGDVQVPPATDATLQELVDLVRGDAELTLVVSHEFGPDDLAAMQRRANPTPDEARELAARLRQQRAAVTAGRAEAAAHARAMLAAGQRQEALVALAQLRKIDAGLGTMARALDAALALQRPGAERRADARTRAAAMSLARGRQQELLAWLRQRLGAEAATRVELRQPRASGSNAEGARLTLTPVRRSGG